MIIGLGAIYFAPADCLPKPRLVITLPPTAAQAIAFDFSRIARDFKHAIDKEENRKQMEMDLKCERSTT